MDKRRINVRAIIYRDGELLANKFHTKQGESTYWATPGGGLEAGETLKDGLSREILEETGITAKIGNLLYIQQFHSMRSAHDEELELFFHIINSEDFETIDLNQTTHGAEELTRCEFIDPLKEHILPEFLGRVDINEAIQKQGPPTIYTYFD